MGALRERALGGTAALLALLALLAGCGAANSTVTAGGPDDDSDTKALRKAATEVVSDYVELMRVASVRPVTQKDLEAAQIAEDAPGVDRYLHNFDTERQAGWKGEEVDIGYRIKDITRESKGVATVDAIIWWEGVLSDGGPTGGQDPHQIRVENRDGEWLLTKDYVNYFPNTTG